MKHDLSGPPAGPSRAMMRARYLSALILIAFLALGEYVVIDRLIETQEHQASFLEQSARQRMLLQRIALVSQQLISTSELGNRDQIRLRLHESLEEMRATHAAIAHAIGSYEDLASLWKRRREMYVDEPLRLERELHRYIAAVDSLLLAPADRLVPGNPHFRLVLRATSGETATMLQEVVGRLVRANEEDLHHIRTIARTMLAGSFFSLLLVGLLLFEPMVRRLQHERELLVRANQKLARVSATDGLTEAANRRAFEERLDEEWRRASRDAVPLTLLMIDIDHFKAYNDRYGHQAGDECLKLITRDFRTRLRRPADFLARYGGEEFAIILPDTDLSGAVIVAEDLRRRTIALEISHDASPVAGVVTLSIGVAEAEPTANRWCAADLVAAADRALYEAKHLGRNRVTSAWVGAREGAAYSGRDLAKLRDRHTPPPIKRRRGSSAPAEGPTLPPAP